MPKGKYPMRKYRKKRRGHGSKFKASIYKPIRYTVLADRLFCKMKYADALSLTSVNSVMTSLSWRGNGLQDPNAQPFQGHQPRGYDQLAAFYDKFRVHGCKCQFFGTVDNDATGANIYLRASTENDDQTLFIDNLELPRNVTTAVGKGTGNNKFQLKMYQSTKSLKGLRDLGQSDQYSGLTGVQDPGLADQWFFITGMSGQSSSATCTIEGFVKLTYYVEFYDKVLLPIS